MIQVLKKFTIAFSILLLVISCGSVKKQRINEYLKASEVEVLKEKETKREVKKDVKKKEVIDNDITEDKIKADSLIIVKPDGTKEKYYNIKKDSKKDKSKKNTDTTDKSIKKEDLKEKEDTKAKEDLKTKDKNLDKSPDKSFNSTLKWFAVLGVIAVIIFLLVKTKK